MRIHHASTWLLAIVFPLTSLLPVAVRADDAQSLLAKHRAFVGWQYGDGSVTSLRLERTYTDASGKVTQHAIENRLGLAYRRDYKSTTGEGGTEGFTGRLFWTTSANGFTVPIVGDGAKYNLAIDVLLLEGSTELPATLQGSATVDGRSVSVVRVTMNGALPFDVYEDPQTGAYLRAVIDPGGVQETTINIDSYADLGPGKKIIGSWSIGDNGGKYAYTKIALNAAVGANTLEPPLPTAAWAFSNSQPFPVKVTDLAIYVEAKVNGVPGLFILDTGASEIALTEDFANRAHVKVVGRTSTFGIGGDATELVRKADTVEIGGNTLSNVIVGSVKISLNDTSGNQTLYADGLMGFDLFAGSVVDLSIGGKTMRISAPTADPPAAPPGSVAVPVDLTELVPRVPANLDGKLDVMAILDTGNAGDAVFSKQIEHHGVNIVANRQYGMNAMMSGVGGEEFSICGPLARIGVGPFVYTNTQICESPNWDLRDGLVGYDFLRHFDYVFDYLHGIVYMTPLNNS